MYFELFDPFTDEVVFESEDREEVEAARDEFARAGKSYGIREEPAVPSPL